MYTSHMPWNGPKVLPLRERAALVNDILSDRLDTILPAIMRESDIDAATVLGIGFPEFRGGVLRYARDSGLDKVIAQLEAIELDHPGPYRPCELLYEMKGT